MWYLVMVSAKSVSRRVTSEERVPVVIPYDSEAGEFTKQPCAVTETASRQA